MIKSNFFHTLKNDLFKGLSFNFIFYSLNLLLVYFLAIVITKYFGSEVYGRYSLIKSMIMIFIIINTLGLNTNAIRLSADVNHYFEGYFKSDYLIKSYKLLLLFSIVVVILLILFKSFIANDFFKDQELELYLDYFPFILFFSVLLNFNSNVLKGQGKIIVFSFVSSFLNNLIFLLLILIGYFFFAVDTDSFLMIFLLISFAISCFYSLLKLLPFKKSYDYKNILYSKLLKDSFPMMMSSAMIFIIFSLDSIMIGFFETSEKVGVYRIVSQISALNSIFLIIFSSVIAPKISNFYSKKESKNIQSLVIKSSKIIFYISLPILVVILVFSDTILAFFGEDFKIGKTSIIILSLSQFFYSYTGLVDLILNMTKNQKIFGKITIVTGIVNVILNIILIPIFDITGAAIATGISLIMTNALGTYYIKKEFGYFPVFIPFKK